MADRGHGPPAGREAPDEVNDAAVEPEMIGGVSPRDHERIELPRLRQGRGPIDGRGLARSMRLERMSVHAQGCHRAVARDRPTARGGTWTPRRATPTPPAGSIGGEWAPRRWAWPRRSSWQANP